jgi:hypothetical protein
MNKEIAIQITLEQPPAGIDFALQKGSGNNYETTQLQRSSTGDLHFTCMIGTKTGKDGQPDFNGPFVQGPIGQRFIYIDIGTYAGQKGTVWSRRLKVPLRDISQAMLDELTTDNKILRTHIEGTDKDGGPTCATPKPFAGWRVEDKS